MKRISITVTDQLYQLIKDTAALSHLKPTTWCYVTIRDLKAPEIPASKLDYKYLDELGKIGNNLNQIAKKINAGQNLNVDISAINDLQELLRKIEFELFYD